MGRPEKPVDHTVPARGELAEYLRAHRHQSGLTYQVLAARAGVSAATLKRAASGRVVPPERTMVAFLRGCGSSKAVIDVARERWRRVRVVERGRLRSLRAPRPEFIHDVSDLSHALERVYELAGAPPLREVRDRNPDPWGKLPLSSLARMVRREATPGDRRQLQAFLVGCGVPEDRHQPWLDAWDRIRGRGLPESLLESASGSRRLFGHRDQAVLRPYRGLRGHDDRLVPVVQVNPQIARTFEALLPSEIEEAIALGIRSLYAARAHTNGGPPTFPSLAWGWGGPRPDLRITTPDGTRVFEVKSTVVPPQTAVGIGPQREG